MRILRALVPFVAAPVFLLHAQVRVAVAPDTLHLVVGQSTTATCAVSKNGRPLTDTCKWFSRNIAVATTTTDTRTATVTARAPGSTRLVASARTKRDSAFVVTIAAPTDTVTLPPPSIGEQALPADTILSMMSVQTHIEREGSVYGQFDNIVKPRLCELGIRHVREIMEDNSNTAAKFQTLHNQCGITLIAGCWPINGNYTNASHCLSRAALYTPSVIFAFDGWNEVDGKMSAWTGPYKAWQVAMWNAYKGNPTWAGKWVLANSLASAGSALTLANAVGDMSPWADAGNPHSYPTSAGMPSNVSNAWIPNWRKVTGSKPLVATETGYHNCLPCGTPGVSYLAQAKYLSRLPFEYLNRNVAMASLYELLDEANNPTGDREDNWGLLFVTGAPKPSYTTLKNIFTLLADPGPAFAPGKLNYALANTLPSTHHTLLAKRDGRMYLVMWQEILVWANKTDVTNPPRPVTLTLPSARTWQVYTPRLGLSPTASGIGATITLQVPDEVMVVEIGP